MISGTNGLVLYSEDRTAPYAPTSKKAKKSPASVPSTKWFFRKVSVDSQTGPTTSKTPVFPLFFLDTAAAACSAAAVDWLSKFNGFFQLMQGGLGWQSDCMEVLIGLYTDLRIVPESFKSEPLNPQKMAIRLGWQSDCMEVLIGLCTDL